MALFKVFRGSSQNLPQERHDGYAYLTTDDGKFYIDTSDKRILINPDPDISELSIPAERVSYQYNSAVTNVGLILDMLLSSQSVNIIIKTTAQWQSGAGSVTSTEGTFYVYSDGYSYTVTIMEQGQETIKTITVPRIKLGDGHAFIVDLPFIDEQYMTHIAGTTIHVSETDRTFWNTHLVCIEDSENARCKFGYITSPDFNFDFSSMIQQG